MGAWRPIPKTIIGLKCLNMSMLLQYLWTKSYIHIRILFVYLLFVYIAIFTYIFLISLNFFLSNLSSTRLQKKKKNKKNMGKNKLFQYSNEVKLNLLAPLVVHIVGFFSGNLFMQKKKKIQKLFNYFFFLFTFPIFTQFMFILPLRIHFMWCVARVTWPEIRPPE